MKPPKPIYRREAGEAKESEGKEEGHSRKEKSVSLGNSFKSNKKLSEGRLEAQNFKIN